MRVLGVQCTAKHAFFSVVDGGEVVDLGPPRVSAAQSTDADAALWETLGTFGHVLDEVRPERVALLLPGTGVNANAPHSVWAPRIQLETLLRMAAAKRDVAVDQLARATVLAKLGLPRKGKFEDLVKPAVPEVGAYWMAGRLSAAAAALVASSL